MVDAQYGMHTLMLFIFRPLSSLFIIHFISEFSCNYMNNTEQIEQD